MTTPDVAQAEMKAALIAKYPYLANMRDLCDDLRRTAPQHTYANDAELLASSKSCLDINMQIPSTDLPGILTTLHRVYGVLGAQQRIMELLFTDPRELSLDNATLRKQAEFHATQHGRLKAMFPTGRGEVTELRARVAEYKNALRTIKQWDCLNPPRAALLGDLPWLSGLVDAALASQEENP